MRRAVWDEGDGLNRVDRQRACSQSTRGAVERGLPGGRYETRKDEPVPDAVCVILESAVTSWSRHGLSTGVPGCPVFRSD